MFFFPSGRSVDKHVRQGLASGGAVRQSTCGRLDEVPVPRKMSSTGSSGKGVSIAREPMVVVDECGGVLVGVKMCSGASIDRQKALYVSSWSSDGAAKLTRGSDRPWPLGWSDTWRTALETLRWIFLAALDRRRRCCCAKPSKGCVAHLERKDEIYAHPPTHAS